MAYTRCGIALPKTHTASQITVAKTPLATFESNVSGLYIPEILAYIQATQSGSGDPSPINPRAISGVTQVDTTVCGVNIWDEQWEVGGISSSTGQNTTATNRIRSKNYIRISPQTQYYFKASNSFRVFYYTATKEFIDATNTVAGNFIFTTPDGVHYMRFILVTDTFVQNDVSINYPATDTAYHAYTGTTATTDLGGTYCGGYVNVPTGLMTVIKALFDLGSVNYTYNSTHGFFYTNMPADSADNIIGGREGMSDIYKLYQGNLAGFKLTDNTFTYNNSSIGGAKTIGIRDTYTTDPDVFKTRVTGHYVVYELAIPQAYQLTPAQLEQLLGQNNVFCSTGDVAVKYWKID